MMRSLVFQSIRDSQLAMMADSTAKSAVGGPNPKSILQDLRHLNSRQLLELKSNTKPKFKQSDFNNLLALQKEGDESMGKPVIHLRNSVIDQYKNSKSESNPDAFFKTTVDNDRSNRSHGSLTELDIGDDGNKMNEMSHTMSQNHIETSFGGELNRTECDRST